MGRRRPAELGRGRPIASSGLDECVEFHLSHGEMIRLLRGNGFEVCELIELRPGPDAVSRVGYVSAEWARRWPSEEVWRARLASKV